MGAPSAASAADASSAPRAITADKALARDYVRAKVGAHVLTKAYAITDDPRSIDWGAVPRTYVCKPTHASSAVIVVSDDADPDTRLPTARDGRWQRSFVRPEHAPRERVVEVALRWMDGRFGWGPGSTHEHQYRRMTPRVLVEELLRRPDGALAYDYKFFVFHGRCEMITVVRDRMGGKRTDRFRPDWRRLEVRGDSPAADVPPPPPARLDEMLRIAETLGAETDFVRVDLYELGDRIVFGELTHTPHAGRRVDRDYDELLGSYWARGR